MPRVLTKWGARIVFRDFYVPFRNQPSRQSTLKVILRWPSSKIRSRRIFEEFDGQKLVLRSASTRESMHRAALQLLILLELQYTIAVSHPPFMQASSSVIIPSVVTNGDNYCSCAGAGGSYYTTNNSFPMHQQTRSSSTSAAAVFIFLFVDIIYH